MSDCIIFQNLLYCTATIEKAAKHNVASRIRKCPHRPIFSASSSCCMNLQIRTSTMKIQKLLFCTGYVIIPGTNLHIFFVIVRRNVRQTGYMMPCVMLLRNKEEVKYFNYFVSILFTLKCHIIPYKLTPLFPDDVECTHLT